MRVLITSGGTREPIDGVRVIANSSSGATGAAIADAFHTAGYSVVLLRARQSVRPQKPVYEALFTTVAELDQSCRELLSSEPFKLVIHAAAVSDFVVESVTIDGVRHPAPFTGKLHSSARLSLELVPGKKILPELKGYSQNPEMRLVGFKLTDGASDAEIRTAVGRVLAAGADLVVQNDQQTMAQTRATLWTHDGPTATLSSLTALCQALVRYANSL